MWLLNGMLKHSCNCFFSVKGIIQMKTCMTEELTEKPPFQLYSSLLNKSWPRFNEESCQQMQIRKLTRLSWKISTFVILSWQVVRQFFISFFPDNDLLLNFPLQPIICHVRHAHRLSSLTLGAFKLFLMGQRSMWKFSTWLLKCLRGSSVSRIIHDVWRE